MLAALWPPVPTQPNTQSTETTAGFFNLINALFGSAEPEIEPQTPQATQTSASPKQIAQALLRSMLKENKQQSLGALDRVDLPVAPAAIAPAPVQPATPNAETIPNDAARLNMAELPAEAKVATPVAPVAELAFTARLTPHAEAVPQSATPQSTASRNPIEVPHESAPAAVAQDEDEHKSSPRVAPVSLADTKAKPTQDREPAFVRVAAAAAISGPPPDHSGTFVRTIETPAATDSAPAAVKSETPVAGAAQALRASEPVTTAVAPPIPAPAQEIAVRIARPEEPAVDLHIIERAGQIHVAVRTPDTVLQTALRHDLGTLAGSLERAGYHTDVFTPRDAVARLNSSSEMSFREERPFHGRQQQQQQQQPRGSRQQRWLEELEKQS